MRGKETCTVQDIKSSSIYSPSRCIYYTCNAAFECCTYFLELTLPFYLADSLFLLLVGFHSDGGFTDFAISVYCCAPSTETKLRGIVRFYDFWECFPLKFCRHKRKRSSYSIDNDSSSPIRERPEVESSPTTRPTPAMRVCVHLLLIVALAGKCYTFSDHRNFFQNCFQGLSPRAGFNR